MGERQQEWTHEAQARFALVVHAVPASVAPRRSPRWFWPWAKGSCNRITCDAPLTRERAKSARMCIRQHPAVLGETGRFGPLGGTAAAHIGARVGKSGAVSSPGAKETGLDHP